MMRSPLTPIRAYFRRAWRHTLIGAALVLIVVQLLATIVAATMLQQATRAPLTPELWLVVTGVVTPIASAAALSVAALIFNRAIRAMPIALAESALGTLLEVLASTRFPAGMFRFWQRDRNPPAP